MTPLRRSLLLEVMAGHTEALPILYHLDCYFKCDEMLRWLIKNNLTGVSFYQWFKIECNNSLLELSKKILSKIEKERKPSILFGRDLL